MHTNMPTSYDTAGETNIESVRKAAGGAVRKWGLRVGVGVVALLALDHSWFTIDQTELGNVRRFGTVLYPRDKPLGPGLHFKMPFIDTADKMALLNSEWVRRCAG
jgi:regulator of protease activity HflC (stomatin/prohibitin superfamily)